MFDLSSIENALQKIQYSVKWLFGLRLAWLLSFMFFLGVVGRMATGDGLLRGFIAAVCYIFLFMPDTYAKPRFRLISLAVTDFFFLVLGVGLSPLRSVPVILFTTAVFICCFFARSTRLWFGVTLLYLVLLQGLNLQPAFALVPFPANRTPLDLTLTSTFLLVLCLYAGFLGISFRPVAGSGDVPQPSSQTKRMLQQAVQRLVNARSLRELLQEIQTSIVLGLGAIQVEMLQVTKDRVSFLNFTSPEDKEDEFAVDGLTGLKQCLTTRVIWEAGVPSQPHRPRTGPITNVMDAIRGEFIALLYQEDGNPTAYCARIFFHRNDLGAQEKEFLDNLRDLSTIAIRNLLKMEDSQAERKDLAGKLQQAQKENQSLQVTLQMINRLSSVTTPKHCLDTIHEAFQQLLGQDTLLMFQAVDNGSQLRLSDYRSKQPIYMEPGFSLPASNTTVGSALRKRSIVFKAALKPGEGNGESQEDLNHLLRDNIRSLFILPLAEGSKATPFGVMVIGSGTAGHFRMDQMEVLGNVMPLLGNCIRKAQAHAENARLLRDAQLFETILPLFHAEQSEDSLWPEIAVKLRETWPFDECQTFGFQPLSGELVNTVQGWDASEPEQTRISLDAEGLIARVGRERQPFMTGNTLKDPACQDNSSMPSSRMVVPVSLGEELLGLIDATANRENAFTASDLRSLMALARLVGLSVLNSRSGGQPRPVAAIDPLTGLYSRQHLIERLEVEIAGSLRSGEPMTLLMLDIDQLARVNQTAGLAEGDNVIRLVAGLTRQTASAGETVARWDGDSFAILVPRSPLNQAMARLIRLNEAVQAQPELARHKLTLSMAAAGCPQHGQTASALLDMCLKTLHQTQKTAPASARIPEAEIRIVGGIPKEINLASLYKEILGPDNDSGPHTIENLNRVIQRLLAGQSDAETVGDILMRLICILDYQDKEHHLLSILPGLIQSMGTRFDLSDTKIHNLALAAKVYDIGKFVLPTGLLYAPRVLDEAEKQRVVTHVNAAVQDILKPHKIFAPVLSMVKFHHERWDGSGYPWHLKRDEIPIESQIIGLVDVFRAMATDRPYRSKLTVPKVMEALELMKDLMFEPTLVDTLAVVLEDLKIT